MKGVPKEQHTPMLNLKGQEYFENGFTNGDFDRNTQWRKPLALGMGEYVNERDELMCSWKGLGGKDD